MSQTPVVITPGSGGASIAAELVSGTSFQQIEIYGGGGSSVLSVNPDGSLKASIIGTATVTFSGSPSISGAVTITNAPSIYGNISGSVTATQIGTWNVSITSTIPSSVIIGTSIFGELPSGNAILGGVAASISGTVAVINVGSILAYQAPLGSLVSAISSVITSTSQTSVLAKSPGGQKNYINTILVTNQQTSVTGAGTQVNIIDDGSGIVMWAGYAAAGGGGFAQSFPTPLVQPTSTFSVSAKASSQASIIVGLSGFTA